MFKERVAVVTGSVRGIGSAIAKQLSHLGFSVAVTSRHGDEAKAFAASLGPHCHGFELDVTSETSIRECFLNIEKHFGRGVDVLVNNAGAHYDNGAHCSTLKREDFLDAFNVNVLSAISCIEQVIGGMKERNWGRIVNVSSMSGTFDGSWKNAPAYGVSKCALNMYTFQLAEDLKGTNVLCNSCCPGWVRSAMGGPNATKSLEEGAETPVFLATLPDGSPNGRFFADKKIANW